MIKPDVSIMINAQGNVNGIFTSVFSARLPLIGENIRKSITVTDNPGRKDDLWEQMVQDKRQFEDYVYYLEKEVEALQNNLMSYEDYLKAQNSDNSNENAVITAENKKEVISYE